MDTLTNVERMTRAINDPHETPLASKYVWRQARAMEAIDVYGLTITRTASGRVALSPQPFLNLQVAELMQNKIFDNTLDAVEYFLKVLEQVKAEKKPGV